MTGNPPGAATGADDRPTEGGRERIERAALAAFAEHGYDATGIADIAQRAGIVKSVIYHHYGSKAGLYSAVLRAGTADLVARVADATPQPSPDWPWVRAGVRAYFEFIRDRPSVWRLLVRDPPTTPELVEIHEQVRNQRMRAMASLVTSEPARDRRLGPRRGAFATLLVTAAKSFGEWWQNQPDVPLDAAVDTVVDFADAAFQRLSALDTSSAESPMGDDEPPHPN